MKGLRLVLLRLLIIVLATTVIVNVGELAGDAYWAFQEQQATLDYLVAHQAAPAETATPPAGFEGAQLVPQAGAQYPEGVVFYVEGANPSVYRLALSTVSPSGRPWLYDAEGVSVVGSKEVVSFSWLGFGDDAVIEHPQTSLTLVKLHLNRAGVRRSIIITPIRGTHVWIKK